MFINKTTIPNKSIIHKDIERYFNGDNPVCFQIAVTILAKIPMIILNVKTDSLNSM